MLESRSSVFKMFQEQAQKDRQISKYPPPYRIDATKNKTEDFNPSVKKVCYSSPYCFTGFRLAKAIIIGDVAVGKTSLINRFCHQIFDTNYKATIGVDFEVERFDILQTPFNLQIWDTAGQERFKSIASSYYRGAHVVIIVFSMTDPITLTHSTQWMEDALKTNSHSPLIFLVGTKKDLFRSPKSFSEVESRSIKFANELGAELWCVSSRTGEGIMQMFHRIAALAFEIVVMKSLSLTEQIVVGSNLVSMERPSHTPKKRRIKCTACA